MTREALRQGLIALGAQSGCMLLDHATQFGPQLQAAALALMSPDSVHENVIGYPDEVPAFLH